MFLAIDIETTGLPVKQGAGDGIVCFMAPHILEVAGVLYDDKFVEVSRFDYIVNPLISGDGFESFVASLDPFILKMHTENGLLEECRHATGGIEEAVRYWGAWLKRVKPFDGKVVLVGKNIAGFDRPIMEAWGFDLSMGHQRVLDVGTLGWKGGVPPALVVSGTAHRALGDALACGDAAREHLRRAPC